MLPNLGGAKEIFSQGGATLVRPTVAAVARALGELIGDRYRREEMGRRGREIANVKYTFEQGVRDLFLALSRLEPSKAQSGVRAWG